MRAIRVDINGDCKIIEFSGSQQTKVLNDLKKELNGEYVGVQVENVFGRGYAFWYEDSGVNYPDGRNAFIEELVKRQFYGPCVILKLRGPQEKWSSDDPFYDDFPEDKDQKDLVGYLKTVFGNPKEWVAKREKAEKDVMDELVRLGAKIHHLG